MANTTSVLQTEFDQSYEKEYAEVFHEVIAGKRIVGISKLTRLVRLFAQRFTVQERIGQQNADTLEAMLAFPSVA
jgi:GTP cyclohydrolase I